MSQLTAAIVAGLFTVLVAFMTVYRSVPEKRILDLQNVLDRAELSDAHRLSVEKAIERQILRLDEPDYPKWYLRWSMGGVVIFLLATFVVGLYADDRGRAVFSVFFGVFVVVTTFYGLSFCWDAVGRICRSRKSNGGGRRAGRIATRGSTEKGTARANP